MSASLEQRANGAREALSALAAAHVIASPVDVEPSMPTVLVVEDVESKRDQLAAALRLAGFDARGMTSADVIGAPLEAIDLVIIDLMLHGTNGFDLARRLRLAKPCVRVVLTSEYHFTEHQLARVDCGAIGFVPQPFQLEELAEFLRTKLQPPSSLALESES